MHTTCETTTRAPSQHKDGDSRYVDFHCKHKTVVRPAYLYNGNSYTGKRTTLSSLYLDGPGNLVGKEITMLPCRQSEIDVRESLLTNMDLIWSLLSNPGGGCNKSTTHHHPLPTWFVCKWGCSSCGLDNWKKSMLKSIFINNDFLTWLRISYRLCCQLIRNQVWKFLLNDMDFNIDIS